MQEFKEHLLSYLENSEIEELISSFSNESKHAALLNSKKMSDERFLELFPHAIKHPFVKHAFIYNKSEYELGKTIYHELGCFYLQEPSAMMVTNLLNPQENDVVLDLCAAPGGKSIQAALLMNNRGLLISNDLSKERTRILSDNIIRLGINNTIVTNNDFSLIYKNYINFFDKIILDAPCSGSGMFRKDNKMMEDWSVNKVYKNAMIQMSLINICYQMLKPGGQLIYSTCSYSYEEDEAIVKFLLDNSDAELVNIENNDLFYKSKEKLGIHLFPHIFPGEGHYICLLQKPGKIKQTKFVLEKNQYSKFLPNELKNDSISKFGDTLFSINSIVKYKNLNIITYGTNVGELFKDKIIYSYPLSHVLTDYKFKVDLDSTQTQSYLLGDQLSINSNFNGNVLLTYENIPLDFSKTNGQIIKNHYPKYLRKKVIFR